MKKSILRGLATLSMLLTLSFVATAQSAQMQLPQLPTDPNVRVGKLDNGMTYYVRHNETPKGQADFFIAQSVGSILENEQQRGLAHFLEHMCFNGTENFPGNSLIDWLETVGVKFGQNLNAYTGFDETVYNISSVPVDRIGVQDSCLLILHDWADGLLLDPEEINKERGVIHQEWRRSNVGQQRILEQILPKIYPNNPYGVRLPIGTMEVVDNFPPQVLRDYYEAWYRPDNQAIIVVGDIDPDYIEGKIKEIFSPIKMPENPAVRFRPEVADNPGTIYAMGSDKEQKNAIMMLYFKQPEKLIPDELKNTQAFFMVDFMTDMISEMLNARLSELGNKPDAKFAHGSVEIGDFFISPTKDAFGITVLPRGDDMMPALQEVYAEVLRAARGGFTQSEYDRAKAEYLSRMERLYDQRGQRQNTAYAREYAANFTKKDPIPGIEYEYNTAQQIANMLPLQAINAVLPEMISSQDNRVVIGLFPENDNFTIPTEAQIAQTIADTEAMELEAYKDEMKAEPLIPQLPEAVQPEKIEKNEKMGVTTLIYPNGMKVMVKPTKFKDNQIVMEGLALGGYSISTPEQAPSIVFLPYSTSTHGLGEYNNQDLTKYLQGKQASVSISVGPYDTSIEGATTPKDLPTMMELLYMNFKDFQITEDEFASTKSSIKSILGNQESDPQYIWNKEMLASLFKAPARQMISSEIIDKADRQTTLDLIHEMMAHPGRFTLVFVGDIDMDKFVPLANQYLGTLTAPRSMPVQYVQNSDYEFTKGTAKIEKKTPMQTPQTYVSITASANMPYTAKNYLEASIAGQILSNRLLKKIREEMGAVYSIGAGVNMSRNGNQNVILQIPFPMDPAQRDVVLKEIDKILKDMSTSVTAEELDPIKEFMIKDSKEKLEKNEDWASFLSAQVINGVDNFTNRVEVLNTITTKDISAFMKRLLKAKNVRVLTVDPE